MSHDKISAAARRRMAETGESYAAARREVIREHQRASGQVPPGSSWFAISYDDGWSGRITDTLDRLIFHAGRGVSGVEVDPAQVRVRMGSFRLDIPRTSIRSVQRSRTRVGNTTGVHGGRGRWLVNGAADGLVELTLDPPAHVQPSIDTLFGLGPSRVDQITLSMLEPDGLIAALERQPSAT
ncbi:MAG: hypothetical protein JO016_13215 [Actinobacteria bacterium]|nr:hypothetical protein [Actinomycetota bacterium]